MPSGYVAPDVPGVVVDGPHPVKKNVMLNITSKNIVILFFIINPAS